jgi:hypothetical protein
MLCETLLIVVVVCSIAIMAGAQTAVAMDEAKHNKSGSNTLSVIRLEAEDRANFLKALDCKSNLKSVPSVSALEECVIYDTSDGRVTSQRKKQYAYHLAAFRCFGEETLAKVSATKSEAGALTISHLCGSTDSRCIRGGNTLLMLVFEF